MVGIKIVVLDEVLKPICRARQACEPWKPNPRNSNTGKEKGTAQGGRQL
jgi:hypothetical protein